MARRRGLSVALATGALLSFLPGAVARADFGSSPELASVPDQVIAESHQLRVSVSATDPDLPNDVLRFSLVDGPPGAAMSGSGTITWTPSEADGPGTYTFVAGVEDASGQTDRRSFQVTVTEVNSPPTIGFIPEQSLGAGDQLQLDVPATDADEPANALTFAASDLPPGTGIDPSTGRISGTVPGTSGSTSGTAVVTVSDGANPAAQASRTFAWQVTAGNRAPTLTLIDEQAIDMDGVVRFTVAATDADPGDKLSFWLADGVDLIPEGAEIDAESGRFTWTPNREQFGVTYRFNVVVSDDGSPRLSGTQLITIALPEYNSPPEVSNISTQHSAEGDAVALAVTASDLEGDQLSFSATGLPAGLSIDANTGLIVGEISYDAGPGSVSVVVTVSDDGLPVAATDIDFLWEIAATNRAPEVEPVTVVALAGRTAPVSVVASDPDGDTIEYTIVADPSHGVLSGTPPELNYLSNGGTSDAFTIRVSDGEFEVEATVLIEIRVSNEPPEVGSDEYEVGSGNTLEVRSPGVLGNDHDPDNESLRAVLVAQPEHGDLTLNPDGSFVFVADEDYAGADKFTYAAVDELGEQSTATVAMSILAEEIPVVDDGPATVSRIAIVAATRATSREPEAEDRAFPARLGRAVVASIHNGIAAIPEVAYPLLLLIAVLALALTFGKVSLLPTSNGRTQSEGTITEFDAARGVGVLVSEDGGAEIHFQSGSLGRGEAVVPGQRIEYIAADIRGRSIALKVWPAT